MIKNSIAIPEQIPDGKNPEEFIDFLIAVKLVVEELATKAQSRQMEIRSDAPSTNDLEEGEFVAYVGGATIRTYTKINGTVRYHAET